MPVAENVVYLKFSYDLYNDSSTGTAVTSRTRLPAMRCRLPGLTPNQITKINILHMAMDSTLKGAPGTVIRDWICRHR